jgi:hypothetical protein
VSNNYLQSAIQQFEYYKSLGDKTFLQIAPENLFWQFNDDSNSIAVIINHLYGNMLSRWTDFLNSDGEKEWRNRDKEFLNEVTTKEELLQRWESGWKCLFDALHSITEADLDKEILIRNQKHTIAEAINRQLAHYPYHIGQIVFLGKMLSNNNWKSLSIPKGQSDAFNSKMFSDPK